MLEKKLSNVLLGISGGADSTALLLALHACGIRVYCVHCNFHLRGEESLRDQQHVEKLCQKLNVPLEIVDFDVAEYREKNKVSIEMACRDLRYSLFNERMSSSNVQRIAIAHNADDNIETLLLNLFRGTGIRGLRGMKPDTGKIIRPLLNTSRKQIEEYVALKGETFVNDSTNFESEYKRNFIRNQLLPMIEERWIGVRGALKTVTDNIAIEEEALDFLEESILGEQRECLSWEDLQSGAGYKWMISRFCMRLGIPSSIVKEIISVYSLEGKRAKGKKWLLDKGKLIFGNGGLYFISADSGDLFSNIGDIRSLFDIELISHGLISEEKMKSDGNDVLYLPLAPENIELRKYKFGDKIKPLGMHGSKLVSDIIKEAKLSPIEKENVIVAEYKITGEILWVEGLKRSRSHLVAPTDSIVTRITKKFCNIKKI